MNRTTPILLALVTARAISLFHPAPARAGFVSFGTTTDSIQVSGQTVIGTAATYEAVAQFPAGSNYGQIFEELMPFFEDKIFGAGLTNMFGFNAAVSGSTSTEPIAITADAWHHLAFVYDGAEERYYVDGSLVATRSASGDVPDSPGLGYLGAIDRGDACRTGFVGYLDSFRISDVARYTGASFTPPLGDLTSDANTQLLYNFNDPAGSTTVTDESPLVRTGTLGIGCVTSTAPKLVPLAECPSDLFDTRAGITITSTSPIHPSFDARDMFGAAFGTVEPGNTIFADGQGAGFTHFVEWQTAAPVTVRSINLQASSIGSPGTREFDRFVLKAKSPGSPTFDLTLADFTPTHPYPPSSANPPYSLLVMSVPETTAQAFRAELVDSGLGGAATGPRILELDGFDTTVPVCPVVAMPTPTPPPTPTPTPTETATPPCDPAPTPTPADPPNLTGTGPKAAVACQKSIVKAGGTLVQKEVKRTAKCAGALMKCVQTGDADCTAAAGAKCTADLGAIAGEEAKLTAAIAKKCGGALGFTDVTSGSGLGYAHLGAECASVFGTAVGDLTGLSACLVAKHRCTGAELLDAEAARARELMTTAGVPAASLQPFTCLPDHGGIGAALDNPSGAGKAVTKCTASIQKAASAVVKTRLAGLATCVNAAFACIQLKPGNDACLTKATTTCEKAFAKIAGADAKLAPAVEKSCPEAVVAFAVLRASNAANLAALAPLCAAHGVPSLDARADYERCLTRQHACRVEDAVRFEAPRATELLHALGQELRSSFCPPGAGACVEEPNP